MRKRILSICLLLIMAISIISGTGVSNVVDINKSVMASELPTNVNVKYRTHVQSIGWESEWSSNGEISGTEGQAKRLEAIQIMLENSPVSGGIEYGTYVQKYEWLDCVSNGEISGTVGEAKRLEAIYIRLTGDIKEYYDVYYRVHVQSYGWLPWAENGDYTGTSGWAKRLEAIEISVVRKGQFENDSTGRTYIMSQKFGDLYYYPHVQGIGWGYDRMDGETAGTVGQGRRLEAIEINLYSASKGNIIEYRSHIQSYGWEKTWKTSGEISGTTGQGKRLEAIQIRLTGNIAQECDVYYRVHVQSYGWLDWAKNGQPAGTEGLAKRIEAIEIVLIKKGGVAPGSTATPCIKK